MSNDLMFIVFVFVIPMVFGFYFVFHYLNVVHKNYAQMLGMIERYNNIVREVNKRVDKKSAYYDVKVLEYGERIKRLENAKRF